MRLHQTLRFCAASQPLDTLTKNELYILPPLETRKRPSLQSSPHHPRPQRGPTPGPHRHRAARHMWAHNTFSFFMSRSGRQLIPVRRLIQAFLHTCVSFPTPNAKRTWHKEACFIARRTCCMPAIWFLQGLRASWSILCEGSSLLVCVHRMGPKLVSNFLCHVHVKLPGPMYLTMSTPSSPRPKGVKWRKKSFRLSLEGGCGMDFFRHQHQRSMVLQLSDSIRGPSQEASVDCLLPRAMHLGERT